MLTLINSINRHA